jgi:hypothetical protein
MQTEIASKKSAPAAHMTVSEMSVEHEHYSTASPGHTTAASRSAPRDPVLQHVAWKTVMVGVEEMRCW